MSGVDGGGVGVLKSSSTWFWVSSSVTVTWNNNIRPGEKCDDPNRSKFSLHHG